MPLTKDQKKQVIEDLKNNLQKQTSVVFVNYKGLKVKDIFSLKRILKKDGVDFCVAKKTLIDLSLKEAGFGDISVKSLEGQIALAFGYSDEAGPAKHLYNFAKTNKFLKLLGGILMKNFIGEADIMGLAKLPSKQELLAQVTRTINAPISGLVRVLNGNIAGLINILGGIKK